MDYAVYRRLATNDANIVNLTAVPTLVTGVVASNTSAAVRYLKLYNKATAPAASDTPIMTIGIPVGAVSLMWEPIKVTAGLGMRLVTGSADNDTGAPTAADTIVNLFYRGA